MIRPRTKMHKGIYRTCLWNKGGARKRTRKNSSQCTIRHSQDKVSPRYFSLDPSHCGKIGHVQKTTKLIPLTSWQVQQSFLSRGTDKNTQPSCVWSGTRARQGRKVKSENLLVTYSIIIWKGFLC